ncbi:MAG: hypothetical protein QM753_07595 [Thermomicrobiales bacterium]
MGELARLEVNDDQAAEAAVEEEQVNTVPRVADTQAALPADEGEVAAEFEEEGLEVANEGLFQIGFRVLVLEPKELKDERILDLFLGADEVLRFALVVLREHGHLVAR